jgi:D-alanyl-D-alanine carboxypeptidase
MPTLDRVFDALVAGQAAGAAVRVERLSSGQCLFERAAGLLRHGGRAMQPGDRFHLASIGKTFTAALVLQLAEEGGFGAAGIDTPLAATGVLPAAVVERLLRVQGRSLGHTITLRHLLQHTAGLRDAMVDDRSQCGGPAPGSLIGALMSGQVDPAHRWVPWDADLPGVPQAGVLNWYLHEVADAGLAAPGAAFHYSDTGYVLLGLVVEVTTGLPLHQALQQRILAPLGLVDTYLAYAGDPTGLPVNRLPESEPWLGAMPCLSAGVSLSFDWAGGGIVSTAAEQAMFLRGLLQGHLFQQARTLQTMTAGTQPDGLLAPRTGVGLGLFHTRLHGIEFIGHSGAWGSKLFATPALDLLVAGTLNRADAPDDWHARVLAALA